MVMTKKWHEKKKNKKKNKLFPNVEIKEYSFFH